MSHKTYNKLNYAIVRYRPKADIDTHGIPKLVEAHLLAV